MHVVALPDAVVDKHAVVVHFRDAAATDLAMMATRRLPIAATTAPLLSLAFVCVHQRDIGKARIRMTRAHKDDA